MNTSSFHPHHHVVLVARISLTLYRHSSLSFIALGRSQTEIDREIDRSFLRRQSVNEYIVELFLYEILCVCQITLKIKI